MTWALTTCVSDLPGDQYASGIFPLTRPLFEDYCERYGMDFCPIHVSAEMAAPYEGGVPHAHGTHVLTASYPAHRALMDDYEGVVYLDNDAVIINPRHDIRALVTPEKPIGLVPALAIGAWPMRSTERSRAFMDAFLDLRFQIMDPEIPGKPPCPMWAAQWGEEGVIKRLLGYTWHYRYPDRLNAVPETETEWSDLLQLIGWEWNYPIRRDILGPYEQQVAEVRQPYIIHPVSIHPFDKRLQEVNRWCEVRAARDSAGL